MNLTVKSDGDSSARESPIGQTPTAAAVARARAILAIVVLLSALFSAPAIALPSFAQQTGQPCNACHVGAFGPQLKPYARDFKLFGYQAGDGKSHELPIALTAQTSFTHTQADQAPSAAPHFGENDNFAVDQLSLFYGGKAPGGFGVFAQATYDGVARQFNLDNVDVRRVKVIDVGGKDLVLGFDLNNNPTIQDAWNSTPAWSYPYNSSALAPVPGAATLVDGGLQHLVVGAGGYVFWDYSVYAELTAYTPLDRVFAGRLGEGSNSTSDRFVGPIPYWRLALNHDFGTKSSLEVGTYGLSAQRYPGGVSTDGADRLTDWAFDANYLNQGLPRKQVLSAHVTWIREDEDLRASSLLLGSRGRDQLDTVRGDLSWSFADIWTPTVQLFRTSGSGDPALYSGPQGRPDSSGYVLELAYTGLGRPNSAIGWANWRGALQYVGYSRFDGAGQGAGRADTLYLSLWLAVAPFGGRVHR
jgi:hypothetical protein